MKSRMITAWGEEKSISGWERDDRCEVTRRWIRERLDWGWSPEDAIGSPKGHKKGGYCGEKYITAFGETKSVADWSRDSRCTAAYSTLSSRFNSGMPPELAITLPGRVAPPRTLTFEGKTQTYLAWERETGISAATIHDRVEAGYTAMQALTLQPQAPSSLGEIDLADYVESLGFSIVRNDRKILDGKELDIFIPGKMLAFEYNGLYWHSEERVGRNFHKMKRLMCNERGVRLIQIWEDDWRDRRKIVEQMIAHKLGVSDQPRLGARSLEICGVSAPEAASFLNRNHIQGSGRGGSVRLGLRTTEGELVAVVLFAADGGGWDLTRFATSAIIPGGFQRLMKAFRKEHSEQVKTFADLCTSDGSLYEQAGFVLDKELEPDYAYVVRDHRVHKAAMRKAKIQANDELRFERGLTESELAKLNNLPRVYDAGKLRYILS